MTDCVFCLIIKGDIGAEKIFENQEIIVIEDIKPKAPLHWLIIPKKHEEIPRPENEALLCKLLACAADLASKQKLTQDGYRLVVNVGKNGGQEVPHLHIHLQGGAKLSTI